MIETLKEKMNALKEIGESFIARDNILNHLKFECHVKACEEVSVDG